MLSQTIDRYREIIDYTNGKIFSVTFIKADGTIRKMVCRTGVKKYVTGNGHPMRPEVASVRCKVFDFQKKEYRTIPIDRILEIRFQGQTVNLEATEYQLAA